MGAPSPARTVPLVADTRASLRMRPLSLRVMRPVPRPTAAWQSRATLVVEKTQMTDAGTYTAVGTNDVGQAETSCDVKVCNSPGF